MLKSKLLVVYRTTSNTVVLYKCCWGLFSQQTLEVVEVMTEIPILQLITLPPFVPYYIISPEFLRVFQQKIPQIIIEMAEDHIDSDCRVQFSAAFFLFVGREEAS